MRIQVFNLILILVATQGCRKTNEGGGDGGTSTLRSRGKAIYAARCTACHNTNPKEVGSLGPAIFGSSQELIEARVLHAQYPPGYTPQRTTKLMTSMPDLNNEIEALFHFLNE